MLKPILTKTFSNVQFFLKIAIIEIMKYKLRI